MSSLKIKEIELDEARKRTDCLIEAKIDGSLQTWGGSDIVSDRDCVGNHKFPHVIDELKQLPWHVRGEIAVPFSNVLQLNKKINWPKTRLYIFSLLDWKGDDISDASPLDNRQHLEEIFKKHDFKHLRMPFKFSDFDAGWRWVEKHKSEGLVLKPETGTCYKAKRLEEAKVPVVGHEAGSLKGAFLIDFNGVISKVSASAVAYVHDFMKMSAAGIKVFAEIEYCFVTDHGKPFQPRLRRLGTWQDLQTT